MANPKLRFKADDGTDFPEWQKCKIRSILEILYGKDYKHLSEGNIPVLGTGGVISFVDDYLCNWPCALIGRKGTINKPQYMDKPFWVVDTLFYTRPIDANNPLFQYYLFFTIDWIKYNEASGVPSLSAKTIYSIDVLNPCLEEQRKIADFLSTFDDKVEAKEQQLEALQETKKGLLQQIFSQQLRFKADDGTEFPDWRKTSIAKIAKVIGGGTPSTKNPEYWDGDVLWFTPSEINSKYLSTSQKCITDLGVKKSSAKVLPKNTLLLTTRASLGLCSINNLDQLVSTNQGFQSLVCNECVNHEFLYYCISTKSFQNEMLRLSSGSTFKEISSTALKSINVCVPCFEEQRKIAEFLGAFDEKIEAVKRQLEALKEIKKGLLQQMFV